MKKNKTRKELLLEIETLSAQLAEKEDVLRAIKSGEVDALVVSGKKGEQVFTLAGAEQPYRIIIEEMIEGAALLAADDSILYCNSSFASMLKMPLEKLIGTRIADYVSPVHKALFQEILRERRQKGSRTEIKLLAMDGTFVPTYLSYNTLQMDDAQYVYLVVTDLTEHKQAETKLREQATLLDKAGDAIAVRDLEHRLIYWNKGAQRLYGWTEKEALGKNADELLYKGKNSKLIEAEQSIMQKGEWMGDLEQITKEGKEIIVHGRWTLVLDSDDKPKSILIINTDITEIKNLENQLLHAQKLESIGTLAGGIAHDLNNMLTPMMLSVQMLKEKFKDEQSQNLLTILETNSKRGADLLKQVLLFSRGIEGERRPLAVQQLVFDIGKIAKETFPENIEVKIDIHKDLFTISGDTTQLHQVLLNLSLNARDAMPNGGILSISAMNFIIDEKHKRRLNETKVGSYVAIEVSDTGSGISEKILDRIFEPFFTTKVFGKGTGLGLSITHAIVKSHGGFINVYSEPGEGTTFKVYLPATLADIQNNDLQQPELIIGQEELVLVAEDEDQIIGILVPTLEKYGYNVLVAKNGEDAVALYAQNKDLIKVVLMDMRMPVMDGYSSIEAIHKINHEVKIIAVSGLIMKDKLSQIADVHVNAFLSKPYTARKLLKTIHEVLYGNYI